MASVVEDIRLEITKSIDVIRKLESDHNLHHNINLIVELCVNTIKSNNKILLMGNGGSAADAQHIAAEYVSRFNFDRPGLSALALTTDTSALTAIGNDYGYENVFARQIQALGNQNDIIFAYSTSGKSKNIIEGILEARKKNIITIGMTGLHQENIVKDLCDHVIEIPSHNTAKIQECHAVIGHIICGAVEKIIFS